MSKILRKMAKIFGIDTGFEEVGIYGSLKNNAPAYSIDPDQIQSLPNWGQGLQGGVIGGNSPAIEDFNGICLTMSWQVAYLLQSGVPEWNAATTYFIGNIVNMPAVGFTTTSANATKGAVYSNNSQTFRVLTTISSGQYLVCAASGAPTATGTLTKTSGTGDASISFSLMAPFSQLYTSIQDNNLNKDVTDQSYWRGFQLQPGKALQNLQTDAAGANQLWAYGTWNEVTTTSSLTIPSGFNYTTGTLTVPTGFNVTVNGNVNCAGYATSTGTGFIQVNPGGSFRVF